MWDVIKVLQHHVMGIDNHTPACVPFVNASTFMAKYDCGENDEMI